MSVINLIEQGKELSAIASKRPWHIGHQDEHSDACEIESVDGWMVAESVSSKDRMFILHLAENWDTLTAMLECAVEALEYVAKDRTSYPAPVALGECNAVAVKALERINALANENKK